LRQTTDLNCDGSGKIDYDKFKSTAPTVSLRRVAVPPRPPRNNNDDSSKNNFLATVKLRKTTSPAPRLLSPTDVPDPEPLYEHSDEDEEFYEDTDDTWREELQPNFTDDSESIYEERNNDEFTLPQYGKFTHTEQRDLIQRGEDAQRTQQFHEESYYVEEGRRLTYREQQELMRRAADEQNVLRSENEGNHVEPKRKLTYREQRELIQRGEEEAKKAAASQKEPEAPDVATLVRRRVAANRQKLMNQEAGVSSLQEEKSDDLDISSLRTKLKPVSSREPNTVHDTNKRDFSANSIFASGGENKSSLKKPQFNNPSISNTKTSKKISNVIYESERESDDSESLADDAISKRVERPVSSPIEIIGSSKQDAMITSEENVEESSIMFGDEPSIHNISALFANRSTMLNNEDTPFSPVKRTKNLKIKEESETTDEPSINNVSALFAERSAMVDSKPSKQDESTNTALEENEVSINNVSALFASRSAAMKKTQKVDEQSDDELDQNLATSGNSKLLALFNDQNAGKKSSQRESPSNGDVITFGEVTPKNSTEANKALKDDPAFAKYFKMLKMGLPLEVVKHAMSRDGFDPDLLDGDHSKPADSASGVPLKDDPKYSKYFKMIKMGLPLGAIKNAMERDGLDASVMDGDHNLPAVSGSKQKQSKKPEHEPLPKDKYNRTRLHWDTLRQVRSTSVWALVNDDPDVEQIEIDENEFAELFQAEKGSKATVTNSDASKRKNAVKVIDPKRANNGGIILARLKITYEEMAVAIEVIDETAMSLEQVQGIVEYIPTKEEKAALKKYMTSSEKDSADAFDELCECEKFMVAMMTVKHSKEKVRALLFKLQFQQCVTELDQDVTKVEGSCNELRKSVRLRKLLGIVLNIGNRLNTAGPTRKGKAGAFSIESLLKLSQAKAFDKKTTFLHYIAMVVKRNNESLVGFKKDLPSVLKADKIYWDQCESDLEEVENQLENVRKIALHEVYGKNRPGWARKKNSKGEADDMSQESMTLEAEVEALRATKIGLFTLDAIKVVSNLREKVERTKIKFSKLLEYFGEEEKKMSPHQLFNIIGVFVKDFDAAVEDVTKIEKRKRKEELKKQGIRSSSPSTRSRDSSTRDEDSSIRSMTPTRPMKETPTRMLRASSMQPSMSAILSQKADSRVTVDVKVQATNNVVEFSPSDLNRENGRMAHSPKQLESPRQVRVESDSPHSKQSLSTESNDPLDIRGNASSYSKSSSTTKTSATIAMTYDDNISDFDSRKFHKSIDTSDESRGDSCDENYIPYPYPMDEKKYSTNNHNKPEAHTSPLGQVHTSKALNMNGPLSYQVSEDSDATLQSKNSKPDQESAGNSSQIPSMRERARALRNQRMASQRSSPKNNSNQYNNDSNSSPRQREQSIHRQAENGSYVNKNASERQQPVRRKPPSPEDIRQVIHERPSSSPVSSTTMSSHARLQARRERIARRRRIETS